MERQDYPLRKERDHKSPGNARRLTQSRKTEVRLLRLASCDGAESRWTGSMALWKQRAALLMNDTSFLPKLANVLPNGD